MFDLEIVGLASGFVLCIFGGVVCYSLREPHEWRSSNASADEIREKSFIPEKKEFYFRLNEKPVCKMTYNKSDFPDYVCMLLLCILISSAAYGRAHLLTQFMWCVAIFMAITFSTRHGTSFQHWPVLVSAPLRTLYNFVQYKLGNLRLNFFVLAGMHLGEALLFRSGFLQSSGIYELAKHVLDPVDAHLSSAFGVSSFFVMFFEQAIFSLFYLHLGLLTLFRLVSFCAHLWNHEHVFDFLNQTGWRKMSRFLSNSFVDNVWFGETLNHFVGLTHGLLTGVWGHVMRIIPWYMAMDQANRNVLSIGTVDNESAGQKDVTLCGLLLLLWILLYPVQVWCEEDYSYYARADWFFRDHWLGHHDKFRFVYLHGPHHDVLPMGIIGNTAPLEGLFIENYVFGPLHAFRFFTWHDFSNIIGHQYVPGVFPYSSFVKKSEVHHVEHHFLSLYPISQAFACQDPRMNGEMDIWLTDKRYSFDNKIWSWWAAEVEKYEGKHPWYSRFLPKQYKRDHDGSAK